MDEGLDTICIFGDIEQQMSGSVILQANAILQSDLKEVNVVINSGGGDLFCGLAIIDALVELKKHKIKIIGRVYGMAGSMAFLILQVCNIRIVGSNSWLMFHGVSNVSSEGEECDINNYKSNLEFMGKLNKQISKLLKNKDKVMLEKLNSNSPWYITANEAIKHNLADRVV